MKTIQKLDILNEIENCLYDIDTLSLSKRQEDIRIRNQATEEAFNYIKLLKEMLESEI